LFLLSSKEHLCGRAILERLMRPQEIVFVEETPQAVAQFGERGVLV
jgi:hypothetical protein